MASDIQRYEPLSLLTQMQQDLNRLFPDWFNYNRRLGESTVETSQWAPRVDIKEEPGRFVVLADLPGVDPKDIEITMENQILCIKGHKVTETQAQKDDYARKERFEGRFYRQFTLPETGDSDHITANCRQGVLEIEIPKKEQVKPRRIEIKAQEENSAK